MRVLTDRFNYFFASRTPSADEVNLSIKNVYVFLSRQGLLFGILLLVTFVAGINYANNLVLGLCFYLFSVWVISVFYTYLQVASLRIRFVEAPLVQAGDTAWVSVELSIRSGKPSHQIQLYFDDGKRPAGLRALLWGYDKPNKINVATVSALTTIQLPMTTDKRGVTTLPRLVIKSTYPLGVVQAWAYVYFATPIYVYPKPIAFDWQEYKAHAIDGDEHSYLYKIGQDDFDRLDNYVMGESLARVSWSHVARGSGLLTKHFADPQGRQWQLDYANMPGAAHEARLSELSYAVLQMQDAQTPFILTLPSGQGTLSQGDEFVKQSLLRLAKEP